MARGCVALTIPKFSSSSSDALFTAVSWLVSTDWTPRQKYIVARRFLFGRTRVRRRPAARISRCEAAHISLSRCYHFFIYLRFLVNFKIKKKRESSERTVFGPRRISGSSHWLAYDCTYHNDLEWGGKKKKKRAASWRAAATFLMESFAGFDVKNARAFLCAPLLPRDRTGNGGENCFLFATPLLLEMDSLLNCYCTKNVFLPVYDPERGSISLSRQATSVTIGGRPDMWQTMETKKKERKKKKNVYVVTAIWERRILQVISIGLKMSPVGNRTAEEW